MHKMQSFSLCLYSIKCQKYMNSRFETNYLLNQNNKYSNNGFNCNSNTNVRLICGLNAKQSLFCTQNVIQLNSIFINEFRNYWTFNKGIQRCDSNQLVYRNESNLSTNSITSKSKSLLKSESQLKLAQILSKSPIDSFPLLKHKDFDSKQFETDFKDLFDLIKRCEENNLNNVLYYPSVTTVLSSTMSVQSLVALDKWKKLKINELGEQEFKAYQKNLLNRGKLLHMNIKNFIQTKNESMLTINESIEKLWQSLSHVIQLISDVKLCETPISHPFLCYKGIVDCVAFYSGKLVIIEWKTSEKLKPTLKDIYDNPLQAVAYLGAINYETNHCLPTDEILLIYAYEDGSKAQIHHLNAELCHKYWNQWLVRLKSYWDLIAFKQTLN